MQRRCRQDALPPRGESAQGSGGDGERGRMSDSEDLELEALQRKLDDAFETTRPRVGFEDELWTRMQAHRPAGTRLRDAWLGFVQGIRAVPAVPTAAVAALLVVAIGAGVVTMSGVGRGGSTSTSLSAAPGGAKFNSG